MAAGRLAKAAAALLRILDDDSSAIAGGMAVSAYGYVRAIRDVDVITALPLTEARRRLRAHGVGARLGKRRLQGVIATGRRPTEVVPFSVLSLVVPMTPSRTVDLAVRDQPLRVVDADTLVELKLLAAEPDDLHDVAVLAVLHPELERRALALASARGRRFAERVLRTIRAVAATRARRSGARAASRR